MSGDVGRRGRRAFLRIQLLRKIRASRKRRRKMPGALRKGLKAALSGLSVGRFEKESVGKTLGCSWLTKRIVERGETGTTKETGRRCSASWKRTWRRCTDEGYGTWAPEDFPGIFREKMAPFS